MRIAQILCPLHIHLILFAMLTQNQPNSMILHSTKTIQKTKSLLRKHSVIAPPVKINQNPNSIWADHIPDQEYTPAPPNYLELLVHQGNREELKQTMRPEYKIIKQRLVSLLPDIPPPPKSMQTLQDSSGSLLKPSRDQSQSPSTTHPYEPKETFVSMFRPEEELLAVFRRETMQRGSQSWAERRQITIPWAYRWMLWTCGTKYERRLRYEQKRKLGYFKSRPKRENSEKDGKPAKCMKLTHWGST